MRKKDAIRVLEKLRDDIDFQYLYGDNPWKIRARSHIIACFGEDSQEAKYIIDFRRPNDYNTKEQEVEKMQGFLNICIKAINERGLYKPPHKNFLGSISDGVLGAIIAIVIPSLFLGGTLWGKYLSDVQNFELKQETKQLKDSLSKRVPSLPNSNVKTDDSTNKTRDKPD